MNYKGSIGLLGILFVTATILLAILYLWFPEIVEGAVFLKVVMTFALLGAGTFITMFIMDVVKAGRQDDAGES